MCKHIKIYDLLSLTLSLLGVLGGVFLTGLFGIKVLKKQFNFEKQKENIPILLQILNDLKSLEEFFVFTGTYCPSLEHRCPSLSMDDGDGASTMSYSQREYQFRKIGDRVVENCRKIIFINTKQSIPSLLALCKEIKECLQEARPGLKKQLYIMLANVMSDLDSRFPRDQTAKRDWMAFSDKLKAFQDRLEIHVELELPCLPDKK